MRKEAVTKTVYISEQGECFDSEVECLKSEVRSDLLESLEYNSFYAEDVMDYILNNFDKLNKIVELENAQVVESF